MNRDATFWRKVTYILIMAVLLIPLYWISRPYVPASDDRPLDSGGLLAQMRTRQQLTQAELGDIDPASESLKLALLGLRGVAVNVLWNRSHYYKKTEDWTNMMATLEQIAKLQPHFVSVWQYQSWNVSYNVSVEFDNYRHRYYWVKRGVNYLVKGSEYNYRESRLLWDLGWFFGHKFGKSDERVQNRRMFREDHDFHDQLRPHVFIDDALGPDLKPDCWLVARLWYLKAQRVLDRQVGSPRGNSLSELYGVDSKRRHKNPVVFHSYPAMSLMSYAEAIQREGWLDDSARRAWERSERAWDEFGNREIVSHSGYRTRLNDLEPALQEERILKTQLEELTIGIGERLTAEKQKLLADEEQKALDLPQEQRSQEQIELARQANEKLKFDIEELAEEAPDESRAQAKKLVAAIRNLQRKIAIVQSFRTTVNFDYWKTRCIVEQREDAALARQYLHEANKFPDTTLKVAKENYEKAFRLWAQIMKDFPSLELETEAEELRDAVLRYESVLDQHDLPIPRDFPLLDLMKIYLPDWNPWIEDEDNGN